MAARETMLAPEMRGWGSKAPEGKLCSISNISKAPLKHPAGDVRSAEVCEPSSQRSGLRGRRELERHWQLGAMGVDELTRMRPWRKEEWGTGPEQLSV